jgi:hypothetical protein
MGGVGNSLATGFLGTRIFIVRCAARLKLECHKVVELSFSYETDSEDARLLYCYAIYFLQIRAGN